MCKYEIWFSKQHVHVDKLVFPSKHIDIHLALSITVCCPIAVGMQNGLTWRRTLVCLIELPRYEKLRFVSRVQNMCSTFLGSATSRSDATGNAFKSPGLFR